MILKGDNGGQSYELVPAGRYLGVCVDFADLGMVPTTWQGQQRMTHKCRIVFELDKPNPKTGERLIASERFTASLGEKANLRKFLEQWRGRAFTAEELAGFDTENLIGVNADIQVVHNTKGDKTYDNINAVMLPMRGTPKLLPSGKYQRMKDRPATSPNGQPVAPLPEELEEIPF